MSKGATFEATGTLAKACKSCGAVVTDIPLIKCAGCNIVFYCCVECQTKDWKEGDENSHKIQCKSLIEIRERYMEKVKREIEEKIARFGVSSSSAGNSSGGAGTSGASGGHYNITESLN